MNYSQLRAFHAVAAQGSVTAAARHLGVSQPAVTIQVRGLEEAYGTELLHRRGRRVALTRLGEELFQATRRLFAAQDEAEAVLSAARALERGRLAVAADGPYHVMDALAAFRQRHPRVQVSLAIGNSDDVLASLRAYACDVAVLARHDDDPALLVLPMARNRLVLFVAHGHPLAGRASLPLRALEGQPMILREQGSTTRRIFEAALAKAGVRPDVVMEIESRGAVREAVAAGLGIGVVSDAELGRDDRLVAIPIAGPRLESNEYLVCLRDRARLRVVAAFLDAVGAVLTRRRAGEAP